MFVGCLALLVTRSDFLHLFYVSWWRLAHFSQNIGNNKVCCLTIEVINGNNFQVHKVGSTWRQKLLVFGMCWGCMWTWQQTHSACVFQLCNRHVIFVVIILLSRDRLARNHDHTTLVPDHQYTSLGTRLWSYIRFSISTTSQFQLQWCSLQQAIAPQIELLKFYYCMTAVLAK